ncbi:hypothetical protein ACJMK2_030023 [Sinanodonta woodiana]|uniref:Ion transport domain-containing protein n=3 Tax=Sinanodonta woodiana TaxID=1069815 RepID=A0ABD3XFM0_SINWO
MWRRKRGSKYSDRDIELCSTDNIEDTKEIDAETSVKSKVDIANKTASAFSLGLELGDDDSFKREVAKKTQELLVGMQEAEIEVFIDRLITRVGDKDKALLYVVSEIGTESRVQVLVNTLLHRGANPSARNSNLQTPLHFAVMRNFRGVTSKLLENDALPYAFDSTGKLPYAIALENGNDDIAAMLVDSMPNYKVRKLYASDGHKDSELSFHSLLERNLQKTTISVLDCMIDPYGDSGHMRVYYQILDGDDKGRAPNDPKFNNNSKSPMQIIAKRGDKTLVYHDAVRLLIRRKWKEYARLRFQLNSFLYLLTLLSLTFSAIAAALTPDPMVYDNGLQYTRGVFEVISLVMAILTFVSEMNQLRKHKTEYFHDAFNIMDMSSSVLLIALLPLRLTNRREQWHVFAFAYLFWTLRIFKFASVFRQTGAYVQILWRILVNDFFQFAVLFIIILLAFSGAFFLSLRGDDGLYLHNETSTFWGILFVGVRILTEAQPVVQYTGPEGYRPISCILMVCFIFTCCVLLLTIFIAQLSDTYQNVQNDAQRGLEVSRAWIVAKVELNSIYIGKSYRVNRYIPSEDIMDLQEVLDKWETPPLNEMNKCIMSIVDNLDTHKLNLMTVRNRLARQETALIKIQSQLDTLISLQTKHSQDKELEKEIFAVDREG